MDPAFYTLIGSLVSSGVTLLICLITNANSTERTKALIEYKLEELSKKVDKHNEVIERTYALEKHNEVQNAILDSINTRLSKLEGGGITC